MYIQFEQSMIVINFKYNEESNIDHQSVVNCSRAHRSQKHICDYRYMTVIQEENQSLSPQSITL